MGYKAVDDYVKSGMVVGLGTGSTAAFAGQSTSEAPAIMSPSCSTGFGPAARSSLLVFTHQLLVAGASAVP